MRFKKFILESAEDAQREQLLQDYIKMISFDGQRSIAPGYIDRLRKQFTTTPLPELIQGIEQDKKDIVYEKQRWEIENQWKTREAERKKLNLRTARNEYERTDDVFERAVCADASPKFEKVGMPAYPDEIARYDNQLQGYYGVHVGGGWLPVMKRDDYCSHKRAYMYAISTEAAYNSDKPFYIMEDFHVMDRTSVPNSYILFSKHQIIPANLITLEKVVPVSKIKTAPDPY
jgi:hypothetical protein